MIYDIFLDHFQSDYIFCTAFQVPL